MKIIYHCYGGSHSSVTSAGIHLGALKTDRRPTTEELLQLPYFDDTTPGDHGVLHFMGDDELGNQIFTVGKRNLREKFGHIIVGITGLLGLTEKDLIVVNALPCVNWPMKVGGFISRRLGLVWFGRPIVVWGTKLAFCRMVRLVSQVKQKVGGYYL